VLVSITVAVTAFCVFCGVNRISLADGLDLVRVGSSYIAERGAEGISGRKPPFDGRDQVNILVLGADVSFDGSARTDTIKLVSVDLESSRVSILNIPRDTWVTLPNGTEGRINTAYQMGSRVEKHPRDVVARVQSARVAVDGLLTDIYGAPVPIDYYMRLQVEGFVKIIDAIGGVEMNVEKQMDYEDPSQQLFIHLKPGVQRLSGYNAMCYARFRHDAEGDFGRIRRQDQLLQALMRELERPEVKSNGRLAAAALGMLRTDLTVPNVVDLKEVMGKVGMSGIISLTLPTVPVRKGKAEVLEVRDRAAAALTIGELVNGPRPTVVVLNGAGKAVNTRDVVARIDKARYNVIGTATTDLSPTSRVYSVTRAKDPATALAAGLGLSVVDTTSAPPTATLARRQAPLSVSEITLVVGADFARSQIAPTATGPGTLRPRGTGRS
jgi:LCP family protein required for cell wall assembly